MCLSESVSFASGGVLLAGGAFTVWKAGSINRRYVPLAVIPALAGIQQIMEGHVWMGLNESLPDMVHWGTLGFMLFTWLIWPFWIPLAMFRLEPPGSWRKKALLPFALAGLVFGLLLYIPLVLNPDWVNVAINNRSIAYEDTLLLDYIFPRELTYVVYVILLITPPMLSTYLHMRLFGLMLLTVVATVWIFLSFAYISFFCLLAGLGTLHLAYIILNNKCCRECPELFR